MATNGVVKISAGPGAVAGTYSFTIETNNGASLPVTITIDAIPNQAPTGVSLSNLSIEENRPTGTLIGTLSTTDADTNDNHTYTITGPDAANFTLNADDLFTAASFDFETQANHNITITSTDQDGLSFSQDFVISVLDGPAVDAPTGFTVASAGTDTIALGWDAITGADSYVANYSLTGTGGWIAFGGVITGTSVLHEGRDANTRYYYRVKTIEGPEESAYTSVLSAITDVLAPTGLSSTVSNGAAAIAFTPANGATDHLLQYTTVAGDYSSPTEVIVTASPVNLSLGVGTYFYRMASRRNGVIQTYSAEQSFTVATGALGTFSNTATGGAQRIDADIEYSEDRTIRYYVEEGDITALTDQELIDRYSASRLDSVPNFSALQLVRDSDTLRLDRIYEDADGDLADGVVIEYRFRELDTDPWTTFSPNQNGDEYLIDFNAIGAKKTAQASIRAIAATGFRSGGEQTTNIITLPSIPNVISNLTTIEILNTSVTITFQPPAQNVDNYKFYQGGTLVETLPASGVTNNGSLKQYTFTGLLADTNYTLGVVASNAAGDSSILTVSETTAATAPYNQSKVWADIASGASDRFKTFAHPTLSSNAARVPYGYAYFPRDYYNSPTKKFPLIVTIGGDGERLNANVTAEQAFNIGANFGYMKRVRDNLALELPAIVLCLPIKYYGGSTAPEMAQIRDAFVSQYLSRIDIAKIGISGLSGTAFGYTAPMATLGTYKVSTIVSLSKKNSVSLSSVGLSYADLDAVAIWMVSNNEEGGDRTATIAEYNTLAARTQRTAATKLTIFDGDAVGAAGHNGWVPFFNHQPLTAEGGYAGSEDGNPPTFIDFVNANPAGTVPNQRPVITLSKSTQTIQQGGSFSYPTYSINDPEDGAIPNDPAQVTGNSIDTNVAGTYVVRYNVTDSQGLAALEKTFTLTVEAPTAGSDSFYLQAEEADTIGTGWSETNGYMTSSVSSTSGPVTASQALQFNINVDGGDYVLWFRTRVDGANNTAFIGVDGGANTYLLFDQSSGGAFDWISQHYSGTATIDNDDLDSFDGKIRFSLSPGAHTIEVYPREGGYQIDGLYVTNISDDEPAGGIPGSGTPPPAATKVVGVNYTRYAEFVAGYHDTTGDPAVPAVTSTDLPLKDGSGGSGWTHEIVQGFTEFYGTAVAGAPNPHPDGTTFLSGVWGRSYRLQNGKVAEVRFSGLNAAKAYNLYMTGRRNTTYDMKATVTVAGVSKVINSRNNAELTRFEIPAGVTSISAVFTLFSGQEFYLSAIELHEIS